MLQRPRRLLEQALRLHARQRLEPCVGAQGQRRGRPQGRRHRLERRAHQRPQHQIHGAGIGGEGGEAWLAGDEDLGGAIDVLEAQRPRVEPEDVDPRGRASSVDNDAVRRRPRRRHQEQDRREHGAPEEQPCKAPRSSTCGEALNSNRGSEEQSADDVENRPLLPIQQKADADRQDLPTALDDLRQRGPEILHQHQHAGHRHVACHSRTADQQHRLRVVPGVPERRQEVALEHIRGAGPNRPEEAAVEQHLRRRAAQLVEQPLLLEIRRKGFGKGADKDENEALGVEDSLSPCVAQGEEHDTEGEQGDAEVLRSRVPLFEVDHTQHHRRDQLARLEDHTQRIAQVLEAPIRQVHATHSQHRQLHVLPERTQAARLGRISPLQQGA
mmetsp:Transcript_84876/g.274369  ORF Transcript_84876/g.274369 Transcript_84876/m.274369 type:complete len:385 (+) Transcript_84876:984-2138(+)